MSESPPLDWDSLVKATPQQAKEQKEITDAEIANIVKAREEQEDKIKKEALVVLESMDPIMEMQKGFILNHFGNHEVMRAVIFAAVLQNSSTTKGLQIYINGEKGAGKSSSLKAAIHLLPQEYVTDSSFSSKALYYENLPAKTVLVIDDSNLKEDHITLIKRCITNFQSETHHKTVIHQKLVKLTLPPKMLWFGTSVLEEGDDQFKDRFMSITIKNSSVDDLDYVNWELERRGQGRLEIETNHAVLVSRAIMLHLIEKDFIVEGIEKIKFAYIKDRRLINIFLDLVEASAILHYKQRKHSTHPSNNLITVAPDNRDIQNALSFSMFNFLDEEADGRLTRTETELSDILQKERNTVPNGEFTEADISKIWKKSIQSVRKILYGKGGNANNILGGLCSKVYWAVVTEPSYAESKAHHVIRVAPHSAGLKSNFAWFDEG